VGLFLSLLSQKKTYEELSPFQDLLPLSLKRKSKEMKKVSLNLILLAPLFIILFIDQADAAMKLIVQTDNEKEITVTVGTDLHIELEEIGGSGYLWEFDSLDQDYFQVLKVETKKNVPEGLTGAPVIKCWQIRTKKPGETEITMNYFRVWEGKDRALKKFRIKITIL
jgi:predicted secreted protein